MKLYQQTDYRKALRGLLDEKKRTSSVNTFASYAEAIGVQKTFVSKVLGGQAHLSDDQFYLTVKYLAFDSEHTYYFRLLYDHSRSGLDSRKKELLVEIRKLQEEKRQLKIHTTAEVHTPGSATELGEYYLDPLNLIIHAHLGIPKYAQNPTLLGPALGIPGQQITKILERLKGMRIIEFAKVGGKTTVLKHALHLDVNSIYCQPHQQLFRLRSAEQIAKLSPERRFVYSMTFSGHPELKGKIQELFLDFIKKSEKLMDSDSTGEDVYQINFDLFPWTTKE